MEQADMGIIGAAAGLAPHPAPEPLEELFRTADSDRPVAEMLGAPGLNREGGRRILGLPVSDEKLWFRDERDLLDSIKGKRIVHLPMEIAGNMHRITRHLRAKGLNATSVCYADTWLQYPADVHLDLKPLPVQERIRKVRDFAARAMAEYDIFHFHYGQSMLPDYSDLDELKQRGKKLVFSFWGSDMRSPEWLVYQFARFLGYDPPQPYSVTLEQFRSIRKISAYADAMLGVPFIPRYILILGDSDPAEWDPEERRRLARQRAGDKDPDKVYFLHAPSNPMKKGTHWLERLMGECVSEGMPVEILTVTNVPHHQVKQHYALADFALDQVAVGSFGLFGVEMMSWEIPVLAYHDEWFRRLKNFAPVISLTRENFKRRIGQCVEMHRSGQTEQLGRRCRQWVLDNRQVAVDGMQEYLKLYSLLALDLPVPHFHNPSWYLQERRILAGEKSEFHRYLRENGLDRAMGINFKEYDRRLYF